MSINIKATIRWKGYNPNELSPKSHKRVWVNCENCGNGRWVTFSAYRRLCKKCTMNQPDVIKKNRESSIKQWKNPENRKKASEDTIKQWKNPETIEKARISTINRWKDPEQHRIASETQKKNWSNPEQLEKARISANKYWENPLKRKEVREKTIEQFKDPEQREKQRDGCNRYWDNPIAHERASAILQGQDYDKGEWTGFVEDRQHLISENRCIHLNPRFKGCHQHHIMSGVIINIPAELHRSIWHRMPNGNKEEKNMEKINNLAFEYLIGGI